jgi:hypothetical protein
MTDKTPDNVTTTPPNLVPNDQRVGRGVVSQTETAIKDTKDAVGQTAKAGESIIGVPGVVVEKGTQEITNLLGQAINVIDTHQGMHLAEDAAGDVRARIMAAIREAENLLRVGQRAK